MQPNQHNSRVLTLRVVSLWCAESSTAASIEQQSPRCPHTMSTRTDAAVAGADYATAAALQPRLLGLEAKIDMQAELAVFKSQLGASAASKP